MIEDKILVKIPHFDGQYDHWSELKVEGRTKISNRGRKTYKDTEEEDQLSTKQLLNVIGVMT